MIADRPARIEADDAFASVADGAFRAFVESESFSCLGAKAVVRRDAYRLQTYRRLGEAAEAAALARDLARFVRDRIDFAGGFSSFVAVFREPVADERAFERALWSHLQHVHAADARDYDWDPRVSGDPADPAFSFSVAETAFFIVGVHPAASRMTRRFGWPALVFNPHEQFERLRAAGSYEALQQRIRDRELRLEGTLNPNLGDFGDVSEVRQYAGRTTESDWRCPFVRR